MKKLLLIIFVLQLTSVYSQVLHSGTIYRRQFNGAATVSSPGRPFARITGMDIVTGWKSAGKGVYSTLITHNIPGNTATTGADYNIIMVAEIDTINEKKNPVSSYKYLFKAGSLAQCHSKIGSYYFTELTGQTLSTVYIHPTGGVPGVSRYRYEITTRAFAISGPNASSVVSINNGIYKNLWLQSVGFGYGMIAAGRNTVISNIIFQGGGTHHVVLSSGSIDSSVFLSGPRPNSIAATFYANDGAGARNSITNCSFYDIWEPLYTHTSGKFGNSQYLTLKNLKMFNSSPAGGSIAMIDADIDSAEIEKIFVENYEKGYVGNGSVSTIKYVVFRNMKLAGVEVYPQGSGAGKTSVTNSVIISGGTSANQICCVGPPLTAQSAGYFTAFRSQSSLVTASFSNNIVWAKSTWQRPKDSISAEIFDIYGTIHGRRNIFICDVANGNKVRVYNRGANDLDSNIYIVVHGDGFIWRDIQYQGDFNNLAGVQKYVYWNSHGYRELHSIFIDLRGNPLGLKAIFVNPDKGDFRLAKSPQARQVALLKAGPAKPPLSFPAKENIDDLYSKPRKN